METAFLNFELPERLVARHPAARREESRLMLVKPGAHDFPECQFRDFPNFLEPGDLLVFNNTRVFPARLLGQRLPHGGKVEVLLLHPHLDENNSSSPGESLWWGMVKPGKKIQRGDRLLFSPGVLEAEVQDYGPQGGGERLLRFICPGDWWETLDAVGHTPLPPYILKARKHGGESEEPEIPEDRERYQTVFAGARPESVAAPTAGLHFTPELLKRLEEKGIERVFINLRIGAGTFQPIKTDRVEDHPIHAEYFTLEAEAAERIERARREGRRIVAVGTTAVRALESAALEGLPLRSCSGWTRLFIRPGFDYKVTRALLTNFHLPKSTLLLLVYAFAGTDTIRAAYAEAIRRDFRFFSYGDCMFIPASAEVCASLVV